jgi:NADH-quinone oxidoreductase subunit G
MEVFTNTPMVKKAREGVMEFLLANHPLDCPICDQGGECDLQDQAMAYGRGESRFDEQKRAVEDKHMGPLIKTHMTRCIHCTRCIRFATDVAGVPELGAMGRGNHMEVGTYVEQAITSEMSGNMVDLCPVGALTSKPYAFVSRPWELKKTESIDVMDAVGSNIRIDSRGNAVLRVLPRLNEDVNEEWISDKTRFACDGLLSQRLDRPYIRKGKKLKEASWQEAFAFIAEKMAELKPQEMAAVVGNEACAESMIALKDLMGAMGSPHLECRQDGAMMDTSFRGNYLFNTTIAGIEEADACLLVGANPRMEAAVLNTRFRKHYLKGGFKVYNIGTPADLTFPVEELGNDPRIFADIAAGKHELSKIFKKAKKPMLILGQAAIAHAEGGKLFEAAQQFADNYKLISKDWNGFNMLHNAAARVAGLDLGFLPGEGGADMASMIEQAKKNKIKLFYLLGVDEIDMDLFGKAFIIYQGHHGDDGAQRADVVLPGAAYTEKSGTYVNTEGRVQRSNQAIFPPGDAKEDWKILRALSEVLDHTLPYNTLEQVRERLEEVAPHFAALDQVAELDWKGQIVSRKAAVRLSKVPFERAVLNFYMTDPISRASKTMAECTQAILKPQLKKAA